LNGQTIWTYADVKSVYISDPDNREIVTLLECINGAGEVSCDPMIIMAGIVFKEQHFNNDLADGVLFGISESRYTNDRLSFEWIKHFNLQTKDTKRGKYRMLIWMGMVPILPRSSSTIARKKTLFHSYYLHIQLIYFNLWILVFSSLTSIIIKKV
jgi:hypothetical protein